MRRIHPGLVAISLIAAMAARERASLPPPGPEPPGTARPACSVTTLTGTVINGSGTPLAGVRLHFEDGRDTMSDADGQYSMAVSDCRPADDSNMRLYVGPGYEHLVGLPRSDAPGAAAFRLDLRYDSLLYRLSENVPVLQLPLSDADLDIGDCGPCRAVVIGPLTADTFVLHVASSDPRNYPLVVSLIASDLQFRPIRLETDTLRPLSGPLSMTIPPEWHAASRLPTIHLVIGVPGTQRFDRRRPPLNSTITLSLEKMTP